MHVYGHTERVVDCTVETRVARFGLFEAEKPNLAFCKINFLEFMK